MQNYRFELADLTERNYVTKFHIMDGGIHMETADTLQGALRNAVSQRRDRKLTVRVVQYAPDKRPVLTARWPGGTWNGKCGATIWLDTQDTNGVSIVQRHTSNETVSLTQAWFLRSNRLARSERFPIPTVGFRVECDSQYRHDGKCRTGMFLWPEMSWQTPASGVSTETVKAAEVDAA